MKKKGFTIIELLTVITIITILVGILTPGIRKAKTTAMNLKQKAQLRAVGLGVELFAFENDNDYPDSAYSQLTTGSTITTGAHHLAEALLGRDGKGYDPESSNDAVFDETSALNPYDPAAGYYNRECPYVEPDDINMSQLAQVYGGVANTGNAYPGDFDDEGNITAADRIEAGVLTDVFRKRKVQQPLSGQVVKVGSPILYFKAKDSEYFRDPDGTIVTDYSQNVFNWEDNADIFALGHFMDNSKIHPYDDPAIFYAEDGDIINKNIRTDAISGDPVPYGRNSFLLLSAGSDGLYGTKDDVYNISRK